MVNRELELKKLDPKNSKPLLGGVVGFVSGCATAFIYGYAPEFIIPPTLLSLAITGSIIWAI